MADKAAEGRATLDAIAEQVRRAFQRVVRDREGFLDDLGRLEVAIGEDQAAAAAILNELAPTERAAFNAACWLAELSEKFDGSEAVIAALRTGLSLVQEMTYRANEWADAARRSTDLVEDVMGALERPAADDSLYKLAAGYELLMKVVPVLDHYQARARGKQKWGQKKPITRSIERLAAHCSFSLRCVLVAIERLIFLQKKPECETDDDHNRCSI